MTDKKQLAQLLTDEAFICSVLEGGESLETFRAQFLSRNRDAGATAAAASELLHEAETAFRKVRLGNEELSDSDMAMLWQRILQKTAAANKQETAVAKQKTVMLEQPDALHEHKHIRLLRYAAACIITITISVAAYYLLLNNENTDNHEYIASTPKTITGLNLEDEDIRITTEEGTTTFGKNININVRADGTLEFADEKGAVQTGDCFVPRNDGEDAEADCFVPRNDGKEKTKENQQKPTETKQKPTETKENQQKPNEITISVPYGKRSHLTLPDGTRIWINAGTALRFPSQFGNDKRVITVHGEAYLEVAKEAARPFTVKTDNMEVTVKGTAFNISSFNGQAVKEIVVVEGSVEVSAPSGSLYLKPGELASVSAETIEKQPVEVIRYTSWKDGYLLLESTPLTEVLNKIEHYYNLSFDISNDIDVQTIRCTGKIYLSTDLDNVMKTIARLANARYARQENKITIEY
jgi:hypothetical protein